MFGERKITIVMDCHWYFTIDNYRVFWKKNSKLSTEMVSCHIYLEVKKVLRNSTFYRRWKLPRIIISDHKTQLVNKYLPIKIVLLVCTCMLKPYFKLV